MSTSPQPELLVRLKKRRVANNNYSKLLKTLGKKLSKLCDYYDAKIYFLAYRNGRYHSFVSTDEKGHPWSAPDKTALVSLSSSLSLPLASL
jgi:hypothetical protein